LTGLKICTVPSTPVLQYIPDTLALCWAFHTVALQPGPCILFRIKIWSRGSFDINHH